MTADTTTLSYWLNWRFSFCALFILTSMVVAAIIIWKFEGRKRSEHQEVENRKESPGILYEDETWKTCLEGIRPAWLLGFRVFAFLMLLALLMANVVISGGGIFYFYTQWTFTLVTIYFGFGSAVSIDGCRKHCRKAGGDRSNHISLDSEQGTYVPPTIDEIADVSSNQSKHFDPLEAPFHPSIAGPWTYAFQIIYQEQNTKRMIGHAKEVNDLYYLEESSGEVSALNSSPLSFTSKFVQANKDQIWLHHLRLGHPPFRVLKIIFPSLFKDITVEKFHCDVCELAKHKRTSFPVSNKITSAPFTLIHSDIWGPSTISNISGARWFVSFIDDCTRVSWIFLLKQKSDVRSVFSTFYNMIKTQFGADIKRFRSDNAKGYFNQFLSPYFQ